MYSCLHLLFHLIRAFFQPPFKHTWDSAGRWQTRPHLPLWAVQPPAPRCPETSHLIRGWQSGLQWRSYDRLGNPSSGCTWEPGLSGCCLPWEFRDWNSVFLNYTVRIILKELFKKWDNMYCTTEASRVKNRLHIPARENRRSILFGSLF